MKRTGFIVFVSFVVLFGCTNENRFTVEGKIDGAEQEAIYFKELMLDGSKISDSTLTDKQGNFFFSGEITYPGFYQIAQSDKMATLLIHPGEQIQFHSQKQNFYDYSITGSPGSRHVKVLEQRLRKNSAKLDSLERAYQQLKNESVEPEKLNKINEAYMRILDRQRDSSIAFIVEHLGSMASIMALYQKINEDTYVLYKNTDLQYIKLVADSLKNKYPDAPYVRSLVANKENLINRYRQLEMEQQINKLGEAKDFPGIRLPDMEGDTMDLDTQPEKMILVSFWASWNEAGIQRNLKLRNVYNRYHEKGFEIFQVSLDTARNKWQQSVRFDQLPWINVSSLEGMNTYAARVYNVRELPTDYLIHRQRGIIAKNPTIKRLRRELSIALD